jgi:hypothetical protein
MEKTWAINDPPSLVVTGHPVCHQSGPIDKVRLKMQVVVVRLFFLSTCRVLLTTDESSHQPETPPRRRPLQKSTLLRRGIKHVVVSQDFSNFFANCRQSLPPNCADAHRRTSSQETPPEHTHNKRTDLAHFRNRTAIVMPTARSIPNSPTQDKASNDVFGNMLRNRTKLPHDSLSDPLANAGLIIDYHATLCKPPPTLCRVTNFITGAMAGLSPYKGKKELPSDMETEKGGPTPADLFQDADDKPKLSLGGPPYKNPDPLPCAVDELMGASDALREKAKKLPSQITIEAMLDVLGPSYKGCVLD